MTTPADGSAPRTTSTLVASMADKNFYTILGVEKSATEAQIKKAYRTLAMKYHPDKNPGNEEASDNFKQVSIAYAVLSDPNKRRQYDVSGPSSTMLDFEGIDIEQMGSVGRVFGALFTKLGVPIPTSITPKVLALARDLNEGRPTTTPARELLPGTVVEGRVHKQEPNFYRIRISDEARANGIMIICRSPHMSKFKLVLFDRDGAVRLIQESVKHKAYTAAEMYFVPFDRANLSELFPLKFMDDRETPIQFHLLDGLEPSSSHVLEARDHLVCVYGDNWIQDVKYNLRMLPCIEATREPVQTIRDTERALLTKKQEMALFQEEFAKARKTYEAACERLKSETDEIKDLLAIRDKAYVDVVEQSAAPYAQRALERVDGDDGGGLIGSVFGMFGGGK